MSGCIVSWFLIVIVTVSVSVIINIISNIIESKYWTTATTFGIIKGPILNMLIGGFEYCTIHPLAIPSNECIETYMGNGGRIAVAVEKGEIEKLM